MTDYRNSLGPEVRWFTPPLSGYAQPTMVAYHPTNSNVLIAGASDAGLFMSSDGGRGWARVTGTLPRIRHHYFNSWCCTSRRSRQVSVRSTLKRA